MDLLINVFGLIGFVLIIVPAFHFEKYARLLARLEDQGTVGEQGAKAHNTAKTNLENHQRTWKPWKGYFLIGGALLAIISYLLGVVNSLPWTM